MDIPAFVKQTRLEIGLTQIDLAKDAHVTQATVSALERGEAVNLVTLQKVLAALGYELAVKGMETDCKSA